MSIESMALVALSLLVMILLGMFFLKEGEINKKLSIFERSIEELNYQNHLLNKALSELRSKEEPPLDLKALERHVVELSKMELQQSMLPVLQSLKEIEGIIERFKEEQSIRIDRLESRTKEMSGLPSSVTSSSNEKMIVAQYSRGRTEAEIAKDLRIGIGEVDLVLKLANLK